MSSRSTTNIQHLRIIWLAILSSVIIYGLLAWMTIDTTGDASTEQLYAFVSNPLSFALAIAAMAAFFASILVPGMMIRSRRSPMNRTATPPPRYEPGAALSEEVVTATIVRYALLEAPAIIGLAGAFLLEEWRFFLPFGALSLIGLALTAPTPSMMRSVEESNRT